jgi:hypothetical protein
MILAKQSLGFTPQAFQALLFFNGHKGARQPEPAGLARAYVSGKGNGRLQHFAEEPSTGSWEA